MDAFNTKKALIDNYGYDENNIILLQDREATRENIISSINTIITSSTKDDEVVFFYSGHGVTGRARDGDRESIDEAILTHDLEYIWDGELKELFSGLIASRTAFIFDTCKAGGMNDLAGDDRIIIMSSKETESAWTYKDDEGNENGEGLFSHWFVDQALIQGNGDDFNHIENQKDLTLEEAFNYAINKIELQTPVINDKYSVDLLLGY
jgi:hypothetical protein